MSSNPSESKENKTLLYILFVALALLWGLSFFGTKVALVELDPIELLAVRWGMSLILFCLLIGTRIIKVNYRGKNIKLLIAAVMVQPCAYAILEAVGIDLTTSSESSIFIAVVPLMVVLESFVFLKQKVSRRTGIGILVGFAGVVTSIIFSPEFSTGGKFAGYLCLIGAVMVGALNTLLSNRLGGEFTTMETSFGLAVAGGLFFNILSLIRGNGLHPYEVFFSGGQTMWAVIYLGLGCSFAAYIIFNYTLSRLKAELASCIQTNSITVVGVAAGIIFGGDNWGWYTILGMGMTIAGIFIASRDMN